MTNKLPVKAPERKLSHESYDDDDFSQNLNAFESATAGVLQRTSPKNERVILHVLVVMLVVAVVLAAVVKLDRVVTGTGNIITVGGPLYVSPLNAGVVKEVLVKPGEIVKKDQVLATMDLTLTTADVASFKQKLESDDAAIARLTAEYNDKPYVPVGANPYNDVQLTIWQQRQQEYKSNLATTDAQLASSRALIAQYEHDNEQFRKRNQLAARRQQMLEPLVNKGYVSELQLNTATDSAEEMSRMLSDSQVQIATQRNNEAAALATRNAFVQKWHSDVGTQLVPLRNDRDSTVETLKKAQKLVDLGTLVSPSDAIVVKIGKISSGSVAGNGSPQEMSDPQLFTLAPLDTPLEAEIDVPSQDVGFIRPGDPVSLKIDAYSFIRHGTAKGKIKSISEGSFTTNENGAQVSSYFKVRVAITEVKLRDVPEDFRLIPGMTITGDVLIGRRTIMSYLVEGALRTGSEAMREAQ